MGKKQYEESLFAAFNVMVLLIMIGLILYIMLFAEAAGILRFTPFSLLLLFLLLIALVNFRKLHIRFEKWGLDIGYGLIRQKIPWEYIEKVYIDESGISNPGIGLQSSQNRWKLVYHVVGFRRVVLAVRNNWYREFAFSSRNPEKILQEIEGCLKKKKIKKRN
ncbi:MAG: hypothetical protein D5S00_03175 [Tindallia sp. MSAO_Bac2]|nr:MAG: hypothetical protein D5S00_03175 [Tindallia sp. MSAO_Bac2]